MSVYEITLADPTDPARPAVKVLQLAAVGDLAFVSVCDYDEGNPTTTATTVASMCVSLPALREAINLLSHDRDREANRQRDDRGQPTADIAGNRYVVAPL
jgi:hypothetical protein